LARSAILEISGSLLPDPLEQELEAAAIYAVTLHQETDHGILDQLGERTLCDDFAHGASPSLRDQFISYDE
jgi:hypothetical protein